MAALVTVAAKSKSKLLLISFQKVQLLFGTRVRFNTE
jgi:hypothetical protein